MEWNPETILEEWIADRKLSRRKIAYLEQFHQQNLHGAVGDMIGFLPVAPAHICKALDLPTGCSMWHCVVELLDFIESEKLGYKVTTRRYQAEIPTFEKPPTNVVQSKIINEINVLSDFIAKEEISESRKNFLLGKHDETLENMEYVMVHGSKWKTETCPDGIIEGLNNLAKTTEYPKKLDNCYPYWELAVAFSLDLINWIEKDEILESELSEKLDQVNYQMNYFAQEFELVLPF